MYNRIELLGNVGTDPEMRYSPSGTPVTSFRMATNRTYTDNSGARQTEAEWFSIVAWDKLAEQANAGLRKGARAFVEGRAHLNQYTGQDGQQRARIEVIANRIVFLDRATDTDHADANNTTANELPF